MKYSKLAFIRPKVDIKQPLVCINCMHLEQSNLNKPCEFCGRSICVHHSHTYDYQILCTTCNLMVA